MSRTPVKLRQVSDPSSQTRYDDHARKEPHRYTGYASRTPDAPPGHPPRRRVQKRLTPMVLSTSQDAGRSDSLSHYYPHADNMVEARLKHPPVY